MDILFDPCVKFIDEEGQTAAASTPSSSSRAWRRKEPGTFAATAGYYRKMLDGVEPALPQQLAPAPAVNSVALRVSWLPRDFTATGFIASAHDNLLVLCVGSYRDYRDDAIDSSKDGGGNKRRLLRRVARSPVVGRARPGVVHVCVHDLEFNRKEKEWEATGMHEVSLDVSRRRVASVFTFPAGSSSHEGMLMV